MFRSILDTQQILFDFYYIDPIIYVILMVLNWKFVSTVRILFTIYVMYCQRYCQQIVHNLYFKFRFSYKFMGCLTRGVSSEQQLGLPFWALRDTQYDNFNLCSIVLTADCLDWFSRLPYEKRKFWTAVGSALLSYNLTTYWKIDTFILRV